MSPDSTPTDWYYHKPDVPGAQPIGPVTWDQLRSLAETGALASHDVVWNATLPQWFPAAQISGLMPAAVDGPTIAATIAPAGTSAQAGGVYQPLHAQPGPPPRGRRPSWVLPVAVAAAVVILAGAGLGAYFGLRNGDDGKAEGAKPSVTSRSTTTTIEATSTTVGVTTTAPETETTTPPATTAPVSGAWAELAFTGDTPPGRMSHSMVFEELYGRVILYGGTLITADDFVEFGDLWAYDSFFDSWIELPSSGQVPPARDGHAMVYDSGEARLIVFGGISEESSYLNDTWAYDLSDEAWIELMPSGDVPPPSEGHCMAYDPETRRVILFGGIAEGDPYNTTYAYDPMANIWTDLAPSGAVPDARYTHSMVYDPSSGRVILFGGWSGSTGMSDTWAYDPAVNTWTELAPSGSAPMARQAHAMVYDPDTATILLFGGWGDEDLFNDVWIYDPFANSWTELAPAGGRPPVRAYHSMAYDMYGGSAIVFGGWNGDEPVGDTWSFVR